LSNTFTVSEINEHCEKYGVKPFFPDPHDTSSAIAIRENLIRLETKEFRNRYFGVSSFAEYCPPIYDPNENT